MSLKRKERDIITISADGNLPAYQIADRLNSVLSDNAVVVVTAPPGVGKSTLLPLTILQGFMSAETPAGFSSSGGILMVEPRRIAARQVAERLSENISERVGETVGYSVRFESRTSEETLIEVVTEGVMMRKLLADQMLDDVDVVIFDEFHERSLTSDVAFALVREIQSLLRPELRIVIMSATIDTAAICNALSAPLVECEGRMFGVETVRVPRERDTTDPESISRDVCSVVRRVIQEHDGDILVFLPGQAEIQRCQELLADSMDDTAIFPLYGLMSPEQQRRAISSIRPVNPETAKPYRRRLVLATSIAETSLTIEGVRIVIDSGFCRRLVTDQRTGLSHLETVRISQDMATQRRGRAGRVAEGYCYQLWNSAIDLNMKTTRQPEILDADLSATVLSVMAWGENEPESLPWLTMPPHGNVIKSQQLLRSLGAVREMRLTDKGSRMAALPCHPRIANMLLLSSAAEDRALACDIAALLEEKDPLPLTENDADINTRISILRRQRKRGNLGRWSRIEKISEQYRHLVRAKADASEHDAYKVGQLLASAYPERIGRLHGNGIYRLSGGDNATIDTADQLSSYDWIVVASINISGRSSGTAQSGKVFLASPVRPESLPTEEYDNISWNSKEGRIVAQKEWRLGRLVAESKPLQDIPQDEIYTLLAYTAKKEGLTMFSFDDKVKLLQCRVDAVRRWHPELNLPDVTTDAVIARAAEWIPMYAGRARTVEELRKIDMCEVIWSLLDYQQQQQVERLAPSHIQMPNGHRIRVDYRQGAVDSAGLPTCVPVLSVRLQECFGMMDTPCVNDGRQPVLMELLSPGFKPVQLTQDLRSFWQTTYFDVRKELRRRYPKHAWPENPHED